MYNVKIYIDWEYLFENCLLLEDSIKICLEIISRGDSGGLN